MDVFLYVFKAEWCIFHRISHVCLWHLSGPILSINLKKILQPLQNRNRYADKIMKMWIKLCQQKKNHIKIQVLGDLNKQESFIPIFLATVLAILQFNQHFAFGKAFVTDSPAIHLVFFAFWSSRRRKELPFTFLDKINHFLFVFHYFSLVWTQKPFDVGVRPSDVRQNVRFLLPCRGNFN